MLAGRTSQFCELWPASVRFLVITVGDWDSWEHTWYTVLEANIRISYVITLDENEVRDFAKWREVMKSRVNTNIYARNLK